MVVRYISNKESNEDGTSTNVTHDSFSNPNSSACAEVYRLKNFILTFEVLRKSYSIQKKYLHNIYLSVQKRYFGW